MGDNAIWALRAEALETFHKTGLPTRRDENWRYSGLSEMRAVDWLAQGLAQPVNRRTDPIVSSSTQIPSDFRGSQAIDGVKVMSLTDYLKTRPNTHEELAHEELMLGEDGVSLLNTAVMARGLYLKVPAGLKVEMPIEILTVMEERTEKLNPIRIIIDVEKDAELTIIERLTGNGQGWVNTILQIRQDAGSKLYHRLIQKLGQGALHTGKSFVRLARTTHFESVILLAGARASRQETRCRIEGDGTTAAVDGVALADDGQTQDIFTHIDHHVGASESDQCVRTIGARGGRTAFQGKVTVAQDAQKTQAGQSFKALLLDRKAEANAKPELEILADDVKCSHGATIGELDTDALFYLTCRGVAPGVARRILVEAFAGDALSRMKDTAMQDALMAIIGTWMDHTVIEQGATV